MLPIRILLSVEHRFLAELLKHTFASAPELELVGETTEACECAELVAASTPDFWIHSWSEGSRLDAVLEQLYSAHPGLSVIRIDPQASAGYIQMQVRSLSDLLAFVTRPRSLAASA